MYMTNIPEIELCRDEITGELIPEIWKSVPDWDGLYEASNYGRIKSLKYKKERLLTLGLNSSGYYHVCLYDGKGSQPKTLKVHQLIAEIFLSHIPCGHKLVVN